MLARLQRQRQWFSGQPRREPISLLPPFDAQKIDAYLSAASVTGRPEIGSEWIEPRLAT